MKSLYNRLNEAVSQELINKKRAAHALPVKLTFKKNVSYSDESVVMGTMNKKDAFKYLEGVDEAYIKIEYTKKVIDDTVNKIKKMGFSINEVEKGTFDWGTEYYYFTIKRK